MPEATEIQPESQPLGRSQTAWGPLERLGDLVARIGVSVRVKLLGGYLAVALLVLVMAALTLVIITRMSDQVSELTRLEAQIDVA